MASTQSPAHEALNFGQHFAVLNLDLMTILIDTVKDTDAGQAFIANCARWNDAVHQKDAQPLTIFTSLFFKNSLQPELASNSPFAKLISAFPPFVEGSPGVQIDSHFKVNEQDIVLQKTRWYAGADNSLEQILKAQGIDTVIIVGIPPLALDCTDDSSLDLHSLVSL